MAASRSAAASSIELQGLIQLHQSFHVESQEILYISHILCIYIYIYYCIIIPHILYIYHIYTIIFKIFMIIYIM